MDQGISLNTISKQYHISKHTSSKVKRRKEKLEFDTAKLECYSDTELGKLFFPNLYESEDIYAPIDRLEELSQKETYKEKIGQLRCIKGIDTTVAMTMHAETSDFDRSPTANAFASYCGLTPGEDSSSESYHRLGITKQGNSMIRTTLVEAAQVLVRGTIGKKGKKVKSKQKDQDVKVIDYADKAVIRLQKKYQRMIFRGVKINVAITAVARELACFVWGIETGHIS